MKTQNSVFPHYHGLLACQLYSNLLRCTCSNRNLLVEVKDIAPAAQHVKVTTDTRSHRVKTTGEFVGSVWMWEVHATRVLCQKVNLYLLRRWMTVAADILKISSPTSWSVSEPCVFRWYIFMSTCLCHLAAPHSGLLSGAPLCLCCVVKQHHTVSALITAAWASLALRVVTSTQVGHVYSSVFFFSCCKSGFSNTLHTDMKPPIALSIICPHHYDSKTLNDPRIYQGFLLCTDRLCQSRLKLHVVAVFTREYHQFHESFFSGGLDYMWGLLSGQGFKKPGLSTTCPTEFWMVYESAWLHPLISHSHICFSNTMV